MALRPPRPRRRASFPLHFNSQLKIPQNDSLSVVLLRVQMTGVWWARESSHKTTTDDYSRPDELVRNQTIRLFRGSVNGR